MEELGAYVRCLQRCHLAEFRGQVRSCRLIEPNAPAGAPGLRSVADRATVIAKLHAYYAVEVQVSDRTHGMWPNRSEYGPLLFQHGDAQSQAAGVFYVRHAAPRGGGAIQRNMRGAARIGAPGAPFAQAANLRIKSEAIEHSAGHCLGVCPLYREEPFELQHQGH